MVVNEKELRERYANMSDFELADIARSGDLTDVASLCLDDEVKKRGLHDLKVEIDEINAADENLNRIRREELLKGKNSIRKHNKPFYLSGGILLSIGLAIYTLSELSDSTFKIGNEGLSKESELGLSAVFLGSFLIVIGWLRAITKTALLYAVLRK